MAAFAPFGAVVEAAGEGILTIDLQGIVRTFNPAAECLFGYSAGELIGFDVSAIIPDWERDSASRGLGRGVTADKNGSAVRFELLGRRKDGSEIPIGVTVSAFSMDGEQQFVVLARDISTRRKAEEAIRKSQAMLANAERIAGIGSWDLDIRSGQVEWSDGLYWIHGVDPSAGRPVSYEWFLETVHREDRARVAEAVELALRGERPLDIRFRRPLPNGGEQIIHAQAQVEFDEAGAPVRMSGTSQDITKLQHAEEELRARESELRGIVDHTPSSIVLKDLESRFLFVNKEFERRYGLTQAEIRGKHPREVMPHDYGDVHGEMDREAVATRRTIEQETDVKFADGSVHRVLITKFPVLDENEALIGVGAVTTDLTTQRQAEIQLRQAQKMEAVGNLTGGIAHDFNNLLTAILGNLQLIKPYVEDDATASGHLAIAMRATLRGSDLTQRLLAFARRRPMDPEVTDVNGLVRNATELLRRILGADIDIETALSDDVWHAFVDQNQLENVLLNLAINSQDAMPEGGTLTIETANVTLDKTYADRHGDVEPGRYVMIAVSDNGTGIPAEVIDRVFEPFFTTKPQGKGSGLGLSMVYGFAKQAGGHIKIYSEPGEGATVRLYLPKVRGGEAAAVQDNGTEELEPSGSETILLVEDDEDVRQFVSAALEALGYTVVQAEDGPSAMRRLPTLTDLDLLVTDVVLPSGMNGREIAGHVRSAFPNAKVVFMSGYAESAIVHQGRLEKGVNFLSKPFMKETLARKVRAALDG